MEILSIHEYRLVPSSLSLSMLVRVLRNAEAIQMVDSVLGRDERRDLFAAMVDSSRAISTLHLRPVVSDDMNPTEYDTPGAEDCGRASSC